MAQMNKKPMGSKKKMLEQELIGDIENQKQLVETGHSKKTDHPFHRKGIANYERFAIKQGVRRRHPDRVLAQFAAIVDQTSNAESAWEKAILHEQQRREVPSDYKVGEREMIANQTGLVTTALDNYMRSKGKFERTVLAGV
jgi:hypothetical protein